MSGLRLLLIDDNPIDVESVSRALNRVDMVTVLESSTCGSDAVATLEAQADGEAGILPDMVLLDISLPDMDGFAVLDRLIRNQKIQYIPIIIFSSSRSQSDIMKAYAGGANSYVTKPSDFDALVQTMRGLVKFWGEIAELPS